MNARRPSRDELGFFDDVTRRAWRAVQLAVDDYDAPLTNEREFTDLYADAMDGILRDAGVVDHDIQREVLRSPHDRDMRVDLAVQLPGFLRADFEFKLKVRPPSGSTNSTQTRPQVCRDIDRLTTLVRSGACDVGYFLFATNEGVYLNAGSKRVNARYATHHGMVYPPNSVIPPDPGGGGYAHALRFPAHDVRFDWRNVEGPPGRLRPQPGEHAWLSPICITG